MHHMTHRRQEQSASSVDSRAPNTRPAVLLVDDDVLVRDILSELLQSDYNVHVAATVTDAWKIARSEDLHVVICEGDLPGDSGLEFLATLRRTHPLVGRVLMTSHSDRETLIEAINEGGVGWLFEKGSRFDKLPHLVATAVRIANEQRESAVADETVTEMRGELESVPFLVQRFRQVTQAFARLTVLIFVGLGTTFAAGIVSLLTLYFMKSALGIDLFGDSHFQDVVAEAFN